MENSKSMCEENVGTLENEEENGGDEDEYIQLLLHRENTSVGLHKMLHFLQNCGCDWIQRVRLDAIHYILKAREFFGFRFQTAYLSVTYLDRFLSRRSIDAKKSWAVRLVSMACLSLAAKMEENIVPPLLEFSLEDYNFESSVIQRMELLVLSTLEWEMGSITPFFFIHFFANKFCDSPPRNGLSRIMEIFLDATRDMKIMCHKPSVIALAATLIAVDKTMTSDALKLKIGTLIASGPFELEDVIRCYYRVKEIEMEIYQRH